MKKIGVLTIGNEILSGDTLNSNLAILGKEILKAGYRILLEITVPDNPQDISDALNYLKRRVEGIVTIGGLGPTPDDLTREGLALFLNKKLIFDQNLWNSLKKKEPSLEKKIHEKYAKTFRGVKILHNEPGIAPGFFYKDKKLFLFVFPGPPREFSFFVNNCLIDFLKKRSKSRIYSSVIYTTGIKEIEIMKKLNNVFSKIEPFSILPSLEGVRIKIQGTRSSLTKKEKILKGLLRENIWGKDEENPEEVVGKMLKKRRLTLSVAESCTGGLLGDTITRVSGSSSYFLGGIVAYSNEIKRTVLNVPEGLLKRYGAVSKPVAKAMARNVREIFSADLGLSTSGIAGPTGGTREKPIGLVFMGLSSVNREVVWKRIFKGTRQEIKRQTVVFLLDQLRRFFLPNT